MNNVEINWTVIAYFFIGLFALSGFFRGWWKEAITTFFLGALVFLLQMPEVAQQVIDTLNRILGTVWGWLPSSLQESLTTYFGITSFQIDASSGQAWLVILLLVLAFSIVLGRLLLPNQIRNARSYSSYVVTPLGSFLGGLLGGLNGFLIINLVRGYLDGSNLPTGSQGPATEVAVAGGQTIGIASSGVGFALTDLPGFTNVPEYIGWIIVGFGLLMLVLILRSRMAGSRSPAGYRKAAVTKKKEGIFVPVFFEK